MENGAVSREYDFGIRAIRAEIPRRGAAATGLVSGARISSISRVRSIPFLVNENIWSAAKSGRGMGHNAGRILFAIDKGFRRPTWDSANNFESADERRVRRRIIRNYFSRTCIRGCFHYEDFRVITMSL